MTSSKTKSRSIKIKRAKLDPFVLFTTIFVLGIITVIFLPFNYPKTFLLLGLLFFALSHYIDKSKNLPIMLLIAAFFISAFYGNMRIASPLSEEKAKKLNNLTGIVTGQFTGEYRRTTKHFTGFNITNSTFTLYDEHKAKTNFALKIPGSLLCRATKDSFYPEVGHTYSFFGTFQLNSNQTLSFQVGKVQETLSHSLTKELSTKIRQGLKASILKTLPPKYAGLIMGFTLGDTSHIQVREKELFNQTGLNHLLAVSGQHILMLTLLLTSFLYILRIPPVSRVIITTSLLSLYALITVGSPSVWRALIMYVTAAISLHLENHYSPFKSTAMAAFIILLYNPNAMLDIAFQLSFIAVLSIILLNEPLTNFFKLFKLPAPINNYLAVSLAANMGVMPMSAFIFGTIPLASLIVNPLVLWAFSYIIPMSFFISIIVYFKASLILYLAPSLTLIIESIIMVLKWAASIPGQYLYFDQIPAVIIVLIYIGMVAFASYLNKFLIWKTLRHYRSTLARPNLITIENHDLNKEIEAYETFLKNIDHKPSIHPPTRMHYPLKNKSFIKNTDALLIMCKRPSIKDLPKNMETTIPLKKLRLENQNLFYSLATLNKGTLLSEPQRIMQSQIFAMSLVGSEFIARIAAHLSPPPNIAEMKPQFKVQDRNLYIVLMTDLVLNSSLLTRTKDRELMNLISILQNLYSRSCNQFERLKDNADLKETLRLHFLLRNDMYKWCKDFINFDETTKLQ